MAECVRCRDWGKEELHSQHPIHVYDANGNWVRTIYPGTDLQLVPGGNT